MGSLRKFRRTLEYGKRKKKDKALEKAYKMQQQEKYARDCAHDVAEGNADRMQIYTKAYYFPQIVAIMHDEFGYGFDRLCRLDKDMAYCIDYYGAKKTGIDEAIEHWKEIGFDFHIMEQTEAPENASVDDKLIHYSKGVLKTIISIYEVMWLSALNMRHGFGAKRLQKAHDLFHKALRNHMDWADFMSLVRRLETIKKGKDHLNFSWERKKLPKVCDMDDMSYTVVKSLRKGA